MILGVLRVGKDLLSYRKDTEPLYWRNIAIWQHSTWHSCFFLVDTFFKFFFESSCLSRTEIDVSFWDVVCLVCPHTALFHLLFAEKLKIILCPTNPFVRNSEGQKTRYSSKIIKIINFWKFIDWLINKKYIIFIKTERVFGVLEF